ncbi:hypothetical protein 2209_scaffold2350_00031 [Bacteriophage sp.]|nr:hypothetical protein 2209_scaffold2350_00031 [Bacteriophage sp.]
MPDAGNLILDDFGQLVLVVVEARSDEAALRYGDGGQQQEQELEVIRIILIPPSLFGYDAEQVAVPGPDKEEVLEVPGAFVVAVLVDRYAEVPGGLGRDGGPVLMDTGNHQKLAVGVALDAYFYPGAVQLLQLGLNPPQMRQYIVTDLHRLTTSCSGPGSPSRRRGVPCQRSTTRRRWRKPQGPERRSAGWRTPVPRCPTQSPRCPPADRTAHPRSRPWAAHTRR